MKVLSSLNLGLTPPLNFVVPNQVEPPEISEGEQDRYQGYMYFDPSRRTLNIFTGIKWTILPGYREPFEPARIMAKFNDGTFMKSVAAFDDGTVNELIAEMQTVVKAKFGDGSFKNAISSFNDGTTNSLIAEIE